MTKIIDAAEVDEDAKVTITMRLGDIFDISTAAQVFALKMLELGDNQKGSQVMLATFRMLKAAADSHDASSAPAASPTTATTTNPPPKSDYKA